MPFNNRALTALPLIIAIFLASNSINARAALIQYSYTGNPLTTEDGVAYNSFFTTMGDAPSGLTNLTFSMVGDLGAGRSYTRFSPVSWSISDGVHSFSSAIPPPHLNFVTLFSTGLDGAIIDWYVQVSTYDDSPRSSQDNYNDWDSLLLRTTTDLENLHLPYDESRLYSAVSGDFGRPQDYLALSLNQPGTWSATPFDDNSMTIPEPSSLVLFISAALAAAAIIRTTGRWQRSE